MPTFDAWPEQLLIYRDLALLKVNTRPLEAENFRLPKAFEAEANCFSAAYLTEEEDVLEAIQTYPDSARAAASLCLCPELFQTKILTMKAAGHNLEVPELSSHKPWRDYVKD